jgi:hypothetical protein
LANSGRQEAAVQFFEQRWADFDAYERDFPILGDGGVETMLDIAFAYATTGDEDRFDEAMRRSQKGLDALHEFGFENSYLLLLRAVYMTMAGDQKAALEQLSLSVDRGLIMGVRFADGWTAFKALEGSPEFEAVQARMIEHLNRERTELGLEPILT